MAGKISPHDLALLIDYNPETGVLTWLDREPRMFRPGNVGQEAMCAAWNKNYSGTPALNVTKSNGYLHGSVNGSYIMAHRAAWAIHYGSWPTGQIDHINGVKSDNRIANLRDVTASQNMRNISYSPRSESGLYGARFHRASGRWQAAFRHDGKVYSFGYHDTPEEASEVALREREKFDFSDRHGPAIEMRAARLRHANLIQRARFIRIHQTLSRRSSDIHHSTGDHQ